MKTERHVVRGIRWARRHALGLTAIMIALGGSAIATTSRVSREVVVEQRQAAPAKAMATGERGLRGPRGRRGPRGPRGAAGPAGRGICDLQTYADLEVVADGPAYMEDTQTGSWTFAVTDLGPCRAPGATLTVTLPPDLTVAGELDPGCTEEPLDIVTCALGDLPPGTGQTITLSASTPSTCVALATTEYEVAASAESSAREIHPPSNSDTHTTAYDDTHC